MVSEVLQNPRMTSRQGRRPGRAAIAGVLWRMLVWLFTGFVVAALVIGWMLREERLFNAEDGAGYWLGLVGGSVMMSLLLYSLRKRVGWLQRACSVPAWFRLHMFLGVVGPVLILFHSNFSTGSTNSTVALYCMLLVAVSGLIGRYVYSRIHRRLDGGRLTLNELRVESETTRERLGALLAGAPEVAERLARYEVAALAPAKGMLRTFLHSLWLMLSSPWAYRSLRSRLLKAIDERAAREQWQPEQRKRIRRAARRSLSAHMIAVRTAADLRFFERLFSLWHLLHLPLFLMLIITGWVHVYAVHVY